MMSAMNDYYNAVSRMKHEIAGHLPSIEWLVSRRPEDRRTGRSYVLATAFLKAACTTNGAPVMVFDHQQSNGRDVMIQTLRSIAPSVQILSDGRLEPQPAYASTPGHPESWKLIKELRDDFVSLCRACMTHGVSVEWMLSVVKGAIVESVMRS